VSWPRHARKWSAAEIRKDVARAREHFRDRRVGEPQEKYLHAFRVIERANRTITPQLSRLFDDPLDVDLLMSIVKDKELLSAFRYLAAPPVSQDDLETLSGARLAWTQLKASPAKAAAVRDVVASILDTKRFGWLRERRAPKKQETEAAILASTVVASAQRVQTERRSEERKELQNAVTRVLEKMKYRRADKPRKGIQNLRRDAPKPGEYMAEVLIHEHNADVAVGMKDFRILAIECKGSNSEINSRKRINKEVARDASSWIERFGNEIVPAAVVQGVFNATYIEQAQETPVVFFWAHRLEDLEHLLNVSR
jgi:hypothetical protein